MSEISGQDQAQAPIDAFTLQGKLIKVREPIILDIGAHVGEVARIYRGMFPLASIHCFEPFPESFQLLSNGAEDRADSVTA